MNYAFAGFDERVKQVHDEVLAAAKEQALGKDVILLAGKFKGRKARVTGVTIWNDEVQYLAQPYRRDGQLNSYGEHRDLLWDHPDARSYRKWNQLEWLDYKGD